MTWTPERIDELTRLWDEGQSASAIGKQLGISKNAVVGKAHRLKLAARPSPIRKQEAGSAAPQRKRSESLAMPSRAEDAGAEDAGAEDERAGDTSARDANTGDKGETAESVQQASVQAKPQDTKQAAKSPSTAKTSTEPEAPAKPKTKTQPRVAPVENVPVENRGVGSPVAENTAVESTPVESTAAEVPEAANTRASRPKPAPRPQPVSRKPKQDESAAPSNRKCQWPIGDPSQPDFHFCESPAAPGRPYCAEHCAMAYITRSKDSSKNKSSEAA